MRTYQWIVLSAALGCSSSNEGLPPPPDGDGDASAPPPDARSRGEPVDAAPPDVPPDAGAPEPCEAGRKRCGDRCVDVTDPDFGCATEGCGPICSLFHAVPRCKRGACVIDSCDPGYLDCDGDPSNGCETRGSSCGPCPAGFADCDGNASNGCETDLDHDTQSCGGCGVVCGGAHALVACVSGRCALDCLPGYLDCDGDSSNGCEAHVDADPLRCGACGHACLGRACVDGLCAPQPVAPTIGRATALATDGARIYWLESGRAGLFSAAPDGSDARVISTRGGLWGLTVDDTFVYWIDPTPSAGALMRARKDGSSVQAIVAGVGAGFVAVGPQHVYWTQRAAGAVWMANKDGAAAQAIATGLPEPMGIAADASGVFWVTTGAANGFGAVMAAAPDGTALRTLIRGQRYATDLALDASYVYWTARGDRTVMRAPKSGAGVTLLAAGLVDPEGIAIEGGSLYVVDGGRGIFRLPSQGGTSLQLAAGDVEPHAIAVSGSWVIFADSTAAPVFGLARVAK
jgi:hypothetical protein